MKKYLIALVAFLVLVSPLSAQMVTNNKVLSWSTSAGQNGSLKIVAVNGQYFEADQTNEKNTAAGVVKLYGATLDGGKKIVLINIGQWKEIWEGTVSGTEINGNLIAGSAKYTFKINEPVVAVKNPFVNGTTLTWNTSAGQNGTILVTAVNGAKFNLDQINFNNRGAGTTKLDGEVKDGQIYIYNRQWNETWLGTLSGDKIAGKINNIYDFTINMTAQAVVPVSAAVFTPGDYQGVHRHWTDKVIISANGTFKRAVNNDPGTWTFDGKTLVLKWTKWPSETLVMTSPGVFSCTAYPFTLTAMSGNTTVSTVVSTEPFVQGKTLKWTSSAGQTGTILVTSVSGTKFNLDQINFNNRGAGTTKLDGEFKDGKIYIYNRQWNETWVGTYTNGTVTGQINNRYGFTITK